MEVALSIPYRNHFSNFSNALHNIEPPRIRGGERRYKRLALPRAEVALTGIMHLGYNRFREEKAFDRRLTLLTALRFAPLTFACSM